jgi:hypothetical protein
MFHPEISYSQALRRGAVQQQILDALEAHWPPAAPGASLELNCEQLAHAGQLIAARL